ncbi:YceI family protein [Gammaproteobacteria bacterium]|jgi:polyisoprenoid-binding protein YceI|nr:YceI family protein [Pseudomonadales bacterium]MBT5718153.1 YceI family protein [Gammaproteobacteria bacterium]MBT7226264.1 YceI family protein [Gammaproteobacteria bacterium]MDB3898819.1 YceI family protein [Gammaproteobacteria bacterium]MDC3197114.1 YceI family protein [Gammaproteobacteria bacterium]
MISKFLQAGLAALVSSVLFVSAAQAHWSLDNEASSLSFVTVKAEHVAEAHSFDRLSGTIGDNGDVEITIELASVNTMIQIRNERMQEMLFETNMFPEATISGSIDRDALTDMDAGASTARQIDFELSLHGQSVALAADVQITRTGEGVVVSTLKPIIVMSDAFALTAGVEKLREVAGLPSISRAVPVSFTVVFEQGH